MAVKTRKRRTESEPVAEPLPPLRLEWRSPAELAENPSNWRRHPDSQIAALTDVISEVGWAGACLYNEATGRLIDGHARRKVALEQGTDKVPVLVGSWSEADERKILATLDPIASMAEADAAALDTLLRDVQTGSQAVGDMLTKLAEEAGVVPPMPAPGGEAPEPQIDRAAELQAKWKTATGQLWLIPSKTTPGKSHRLLCGDAREELPRWTKASIDLFWTDPPYGHNNNNGDLIHRREAALGQVRLPSGGSDPRPIANDGPEANELVRWFFGEAERLLKAPGICCCCCCGGGPDPQFARWSIWLDEAVGFKHMVVWDKGGLGMGWHYRRCYETVLVGEKPGKGSRWFGGNDVPNVIRDIGKIIPRAEDHPTAKPVELVEWFLPLHTQRGELVADPFAGAGITLVACERQGRICHAVEISPAYVAVTLERLSEMGLDCQLVTA